MFIIAHETIDGDGFIFDRKLEDWRKLMYLFGKSRIYLMVMGFISIVWTFGKSLTITDVKVPQCRFNSG